MTFRRPPLPHAAALSLTLAACVGVTACAPKPDAPAAGPSINTDANMIGIADSNAKMQNPSQGAKLAVTNIRVGSHNGFDRVVFDLSGTGNPGWRAEYTRDATELGSGHSIHCTCPQALTIDIDGTVAPYLVGASDPHLDKVPGIGGVTEIITAGTEPGRSQFVIGLGGQTPYSVDMLENPARAVVDITKK